MFRQRPSEPPNEPPPPIPIGLTPSISMTIPAVPSGRAQSASPTYTIDNSANIARRTGPTRATGTTDAPISTNTFLVDAAVYARISDVVSRPTAQASLEDLRDTIQQMNTLVSLLPASPGSGPEPGPVAGQTSPSSGTVTQRSSLSLLAAARAAAPADGPLSDDSSVSDNGGRVMVPHSPPRSGFLGGPGGLAPTSGASSASQGAESYRRRRAAELYGIIGRGGTYEDAERDIAIVNARGGTRPDLPHRRLSAHNGLVGAFNSGVEFSDFEMSMLRFNAPLLSLGHRRTSTPPESQNEADPYDLFMDDSESGEFISQSTSNLAAGPILDMGGLMYDEITSSSASVPYDTSTDAAIETAHSIASQLRQRNIDGVPATTNFALTANHTFRRALRALAAANGAADTIIPSRSTSLGTDQSQGHDNPVFEGRSVSFQPAMLESLDRHISEETSTSRRPDTPVHPRLESLRSTDTQAPYEEPISLRQETPPSSARVPSPLNPNQPRRAGGSRAGLRLASTQSRGPPEAETTDNHAGLRPAITQSRELSAPQPSVSRAGLRPAVTQSRVQTEQDTGVSSTRTAARAQPRDLSERNNTAGLSLARTQSRDSTQSPSPFPSSDQSYPPAAYLRRQLLEPGPDDLFDSPFGDTPPRYDDSLGQFLRDDDGSENIAALPASSPQGEALNPHREQAIEHTVNALNGDYYQLRGLVDSRLVAHREEAAASDVTAVPTSFTTPSMFPLRSEIGRHFDRPIINRELRLTAFHPAVPATTDYGVPYPPGQIRARSGQERLSPDSAPTGQYEAYLNRSLANMNAMRRRDDNEEARAAGAHAALRAAADIGLHTQRRHHRERSPRRARRRAEMRPASAGLSSRVWPDPSTMTREELARWNMVEMAEDREVIEMMRDGS